MLSDICKKVTVIQNLGFLTGEGRLASAVAQKANVNVIYNTVLTAEQIAHLLHLARGLA
jgi:hypothetical protein